jgi:hypothetical protein
MFKSIPPIVLMLAASVTLCAQEPDYPYPGGEKADTTASVFAPGMVSGPAQEYGLTADRAWSEIYFTRLEGDQSVVMVTLRAGGSWSEPVPASFSGEFIDAHPLLTPDGQRLLFVSRRPCPGAQQALNVWVVERTPDGWSAPEPLGRPVTEQTVHAPSVASSGNIYATGLVRLRFSGDRYTSPEPLVPPLTGSHPAIASDESFLVFSAGRDGGFGSNDLYVVFREDDGTWSQPKNLGAGVNTESVESSPTLSNDGSFLFFSRRDDIWWVDAEVIQAVR